MEAADYSAEELDGVIDDLSWAVFGVVDQLTHAHSESGNESGCEPGSEEAEVSAYFEDYLPSLAQSLDDDEPTQIALRALVASCESASDDKVMWGRNELMNAMLARIDSNEVDCIEIVARMTAWLEQQLEDSQQDELSTGSDQTGQPEQNQPSQNQPRQNQLDSTDGSTSSQTEVASLTAATQTQLDALMKEMRERHDRIQSQEDRLNAALWQLSRLLEQIVGDDQPQPCAELSEALKDVLDEMAQEQRDHVDGRG